jgi:hypothetical protein
MSGRGGGTVKINVQGDMTLNGAIKVDGGDGDQTIAGGAGGSVWIMARNFFGNGSLSANGGNTNTNPQLPLGGGGVTSLLYSPLPFFCYISAFLLLFFI